MKGILGLKRQLVLKDYEDLLLILIALSNTYTHPQLGWIGYKDV